MGLSFVDSRQLVDIGLTTEEKWRERLMITDETQLATTMCLFNAGARCGI